MTIPNQKHANDSIIRYLNVRAAYFPGFVADDREIVFITDISGVPHVWRVKVVDPSREVPWPDQLTFGEERVLGVWPSPAPNDRRLVYARDMGGDENMQLFCLNLENGEEVALTAGFEGAMHVFGAWSSDGLQILFSANRRDPGRFDLYLQPVGGPAKMIWENEEPGYLVNPLFSPDGSQVIVTRMAGSFQHDLFAVDLKSGEVTCISPSPEATRYASVYYAPDGRSLFINTDLDSDYLGISRLRLENLAVEPVVTGPWDVEHVTLSPDGRYLAYVLNLDGGTELALFDVSSGQARRPPGFGEAPGVVAWMDGQLCFSPDSTRLTFSFTSAVRTSDIFVWELNEDQVWAATRSSHGGLGVETFVLPELVHYPTFDEVRPGDVRKIPAWFYKPKTASGTAMPVIVFVHGGPESQFRPYFHFFIQYFVSRGYAVLAPNVRGSTGYGKAYSHLDDVEKRMDAVADLAQAAHWLQEQSDVDGDRLVIYGGSYGGFMVLSALVTYPALWAAGVNIVGISNFVTFLEHTSDYRRAAREAEYGSLARDRQFLEKISPLNHVESVTVPLFVMHGANDPRVPLNEAEQLVEALKARQIPVEFLVFDDEGHGIKKLKNKQTAYPAIARFLDQALWPAEGF